jgi:hypothetical protein
LCRHDLPLSKWYIDPLKFQKSLKIAVLTPGNRLLCSPIELPLKIQGCFVIEGDVNVNESRMLEAVFPVGQIVKNICGI